MYNESHLNVIHYSLYYKEPLYAFYQNNIYQVKLIRKTKKLLGVSLTCNSLSTHCLLYSIFYL